MFTDFSMSTDDGESTDRNVCEKQNKSTLKNIARIGAHGHPFPTKNRLFLLSFRGDTKFEVENITHPSCSR